MWRKSERYLSILLKYELTLSVCVYCPCVRTKHVVGNHVIISTAQRGRAFWTRSEASEGPTSKTENMEGSAKITECQLSTYIAGLLTGWYVGR